MSDFENNYRKWHTRLSYAKSAFRIIACSGAILDPVNGVYILATGLLIAEILGVVEEWV